MAEQQTEPKEGQEQRAENPAPAKDEQVDFQSQLTSLAGQVKEGDLSVDEGFVQVAQLSASMGASQAIDKINQQQVQQTRTNSQNQFLKDNPDFEELQKSGALKEVGESLPGFHDDVSAYYALKAQQNAESIETARQEGIEAGKTEAAKVAAGANNTDKVVTTPGAGMGAAEGGQGGQQSTGQPLSPAAQRQSMMDAIKAHRAAKE